jgi:hypothetical protein
MQFNTDADSQPYLSGQSLANVVCLDLHRLAVKNNEIEEIL